MLRSWDRQTDRHAHLVEIPNVKIETKTSLCSINEVSNRWSIPEQSCSYRGAPIELSRWRQISLTCLARCLQSLVVLVAVKKLEVVAQLNTSPWQHSPTSTSPLTYMSVRACPQACDIGRLQGPSHSCFLSQMASYLRLDDFKYLRIPNRPLISKWISSLFVPVNEHEQ